MSTHGILSPVLSSVFIFYHLILKTLHEYAISVFPWRSCSPEKLHNFPEPDLILRLRAIDGCGAAVPRERGGLARGRAAMVGEAEIRGGGKALVLKMNSHFRCVIMRRSEELCF